MGMFVWQLKPKTNTVRCLSLFRIKICFIHSFEHKRWTWLRFHCGSQLIHFLYKYSKRKVIYFYLYMQYFYKWGRPDWIYAERVSNACLSPKSNPCTTCNYNSLIRVACLSSVVVSSVFIVYQSWFGKAKLIYAHRNAFAKYKCIHWCKAFCHNRATSEVRRDPKLVLGYHIKMFFFF